MVDLKDLKTKECSLYGMIIQHRSDKSASDALQQFCVFLSGNKNWFGYNQRVSGFDHVQGVNSAQNSGWKLAQVIETCGVDPEVDTTEGFMNPIPG